MNEFVGKLLSPTTLIATAELRAETLSTEDLAWLAHEAEHYNDDISMMLIAGATERRSEFGETYRNLWLRHAEVRGYAKKKTL